MSDDTQHYGRERTPNPTSRDLRLESGDPSRRVVFGLILEILKPITLRQTFAMASESVRTSGAESFSGASSVRHPAHNS